MVNLKGARQQEILSILSDGNLYAISDIEKKQTIESDRKTLQRDLAELIKEMQVESVGAGRGKRYKTSDAFEMFVRIDQDRYFEIDDKKRKGRKTFNHEIYGLLQNSLFNEEETQELQELHDRFIRNISRYDSQTLINKEYERIMIEFSWKSSAIEGNTYSLLNTEALIKENIKDSSKTEHESQMILNHKDAFNECIQNKDRFIQLSIGDLEYIHQVLTKHLGIESNIRNSAVGVTGSTYVPLDNAYRIREALTAMIDTINKKDFFIEKSFVALIMLSYIQAFNDGNKRTARMFSNAILLAFGSIPLSYRAVDVVEYKKAMILFYEKNNIMYIKQMFVDQFRDAVDNYFVNHHE